MLFGRLESRGCAAGGRGFKGTDGVRDLEGDDTNSALAAADTTDEIAIRYRAPKNEVRARLLRGRALARASGRSVEMRLARYTRCVTA